MLTGQCHCGAIAFEIDATVSDIYACHCSLCRRATGNNGVVVMIIPKTLFGWKQEPTTLTRWEKPGHDWQWNFCNRCGSPAPGDNDEDHFYVPIGLIDQGGEELKITHHIHVGSKARWDIIGDDGKQHPEGFGSK